MRKLHLLGGVAALLTVAAGVAIAAPGDRFGRLDTDGNGSVTLAEMNAKAADRFARLDADKDGFVTPAELQARHAKRGGDHAGKGHGRGRDGADHGRHHARRDPAERFAARDADKDGRLSLAEFQAGGEKRFARLDADRNGGVTREEMTKAREAWKNRRQG